MTTVIESDHGLPQASDAGGFGLADSDIVELFASNRPTGFYRQDLNAGHVYFSEQACLLYGIAPTAGPVNLIEVLSKIHKDDIELMLLTLEERSRLGKGAHYIFRIADGQDGYRYVRIISAYRDNGTPAGEVAGIIYAFFDRVPGASFALDTAGSPARQDIAHIELSDQEIAALLRTYQRIGCFRQDADKAGGLSLSADALRILEIDAKDGPIGIDEIAGRLHSEDSGLLRSTLETATARKSGFDLICRLQRETPAPKFIRIVGRYQPDADGEGEIAGLVYEFFERMQIVDFGDE